MRVVVPFGKRQIQGFVVGLTKENPDNVKLKEIEGLQDLQPVLGPEFLQLAQWMSQQTFAFMISCLQVMLPNALRASYQKSVRRLTNNAFDTEIEQFFGKQQEVFLTNDLDDKLFSKLEVLIKQQQIEVVYHVKDKVKAKYQQVIYPTLSDKQYQELLQKIPKNAKRQQRLLNCLLQLAKKGENGLQKDLANIFELDNQDFKIALQKGWLTRQKIEHYRDPYQKEIQSSQPLCLNSEQAIALEKITHDIIAKKATTFLLQGVTGSGKTEVYLQSIAQALKLNKTALMLVPEISLTPQMVRRVKSRFGQDVAVLHSGLSDGEKYDEWRRIKRKEAKVVVGARSAVFAPLEDLGLIIMDEEHESSYKQEDMPRYHTRDVALWRSKYQQCPLVLGSATPSLESRARAQKGVYCWLRLNQRANGQTLPEVKLIDMRKVAKYAPTPDISQELLEALKDRISKKEQAVLLLNRRGHSVFAMCHDCGLVLRCPNCDISLTYHLDTNSLRCHYCGHEQAFLKTCPSCQGKKIRCYGTGTQKIEQELQKLLPNANILRMDVDTTRKKGAHEQLLEEFGAKKADILLGTQMIAKGLDFPDVTLVGVLNADTTLAFPDFRANEKTFQLLTQVSGRAGRATKKGEVLIQTFNPQNYAISLAKTQNYERFFALEMNMRHRGGYPPYYYTIKITASDKDEATVARELYRLKNELQSYLSSSAKILGPTPKPITRINNRYYYQIVIKYKNEPQLESYLQELLIASQGKQRQGLQLTIDRNPLNFI